MSRYFSSGLNRLDFFIVTTGVVELLLPLVLKLTASDKHIKADEISNFTMIRLVRVLRPLRALTAFPKLQVIVGALVNSVSSLIQHSHCAFSFLL